MKRTAKRKEKVLQYTAIFEPAEEGGFVVTVPRLPGCISEGDTFEEALKNIREAIDLYLEDIEDKDLESLYTEQRNFSVPIEIKLKR